MLEWARGHCQPEPAAAKPCFTNHPTDKVWNLILPMARTEKKGIQFRTQAVYLLQLNPQPTDERWRRALPILTTSPLNRGLNCVTLGSVLGLHGEVWVAGGSSFSAAS